MTPSKGPWKVKPIDLYESGDGIAIIAADGEVVADNQTYYPHALDKKNAQLIASAPDLFAALKDLMLRVDTTELPDGSSLDTAWAHAVIDKLEGDTNG